MKRLFKPSECEYNLRLWNLATGEQIAVGKAHEKRIRGVVYSPDGKLAVSGDDTGTILLWDVEKMDVLKPFVGHTSGIRVGCLVWAEDGRTFLSGSWDASVRLWDVDTGRQIAYLIPDPHYGRVMSIALSPDAKYALSSYLGPVIFWDLEKKCEIARFRIPGNSRQTGQQLHIESVAFLPDGKTALFGFVFGTVIWWDLNEWKPIAMNRVHREKLKFVTCSADGKTSISVGADVKMCDGNAKVKFWELSVRSSTPTAQDSENEHR